jgi:hypothetical protein
VGQLSLIPKHRETLGPNVIVRINSAPKQLGKVAQLRHKSLAIIHKILENGTLRHTPERTDTPADYFDQLPFQAIVELCLDSPAPI